MYIPPQLMNLFLDADPSVNVQKALSIAAYGAIKKSGGTDVPSEPGEEILEEDFESWD